MRRLVAGFLIIVLYGLLTNRYRENIIRKLTGWPIQQILGDLFAVLAILGFARH